METTDGSSHVYDSTGVAVSCVEYRRLRCNRFVKLSERLAVTVVGGVAVDG